MATQKEKIDYLFSKNKKQEYNKKIGKHVFKIFASAIILIIGLLALFAGFRLSFIDAPNFLVITANTAHANGWDISNSPLTQQQAFIYYSSIVAFFVFLIVGVATMTASYILIFNPYLKILGNEIGKLKYSIAENDKENEEARRMRKGL